MADPVDELRRIWAEKGVPAHRQAEILAEIERLAQPGAKVGPFTMMKEQAARVRQHEQH